MILPTVFILFNALFSIALGETGCPQPDTIAPCKCFKRPSTRLVCANFTNIDVLAEVFKNSERYTYQEVHILSSSLMYLPTELLEIPTVNELFIKNSRFISLFELQPKNDNLYKLHIEGVSLQRLVDWNLLKNLTNLRSLTISRTAIISIDSTFSENMPKTLRELSFIGTKTWRIKKGAFSELNDLDKIVFSSSNLTNISREIFPHPFNVRFMYLDNIGIKSIPNNFFHDMPDLQFLSLKNNSLTGLHEVAFKSRSRNVPFVNLEGNPLKCDCLLRWLIQDKPEIIRGTCATPSRLLGYKLQNLRPGDFNC